MAQAIAREIQVTLTPGEEILLTRARQVNPEAYEAYLKGQFHFYKLTSSDLETALQYFELALEKDPDYALAQVGIALVWGGRGQMGWAPHHEALPKAKEAVQRALELDETLAEAHPDIDFYPQDRGARALARSITAEMHSSFNALRGSCPMMLAFCWDGFQAGPDVHKDLARIEELWSLARERYGSKGPWLFGNYTLADVFYAPVAMRITAYDLPVSSSARAYVDAHLSDPSLLHWRSEGLKKTYDPWPYPQDLPRKPWPGDKAAEA